MKRDKLFIEAEKRLDRYREDLIIIDNLTILIQAKLDLYSTKGFPGEKAICYDAVKVSKTNACSPIEEWLLNNDKEYDVLITRKSKLVKEVNLMKNALKILNPKELKVIQDIKLYDKTGKIVFTYDNGSIDTVVEATFNGDSVLQSVLQKINENM